MTQAQEIGPVRVDKGDSCYVQKTKNGNTQLDYDRRSNPSYI